MPGVWLEVLAEDDDSRRFVVGALRSLDIGPREYKVESIITDAADGDRRQWINKQLPLLLRKSVSQYAKRRFAVLVCTDADRNTVDERIQQISIAVREGLKQNKLSSLENIFYWIPKYHIETWALYLHGKNDVNEVDRYKQQSLLRGVSFGESGRRFAKILTEGTVAPNELPAIQFALDEARRLMRWKKQ